MPTRIASQPAGSKEAAATLVVYNRNDPQSKALAEYYMQQRNIPPKQMLGLDCSGEEEILRSEYNGSIMWPLRQAFTENNWWKLRPGKETEFEVTDSNIRFLVLIKGVPLKIRADPILPPVPTPTSFTMPGTSPTPRPKPTPAPQPKPEEREDASVDCELSMAGMFLQNIAGPQINPYFRSLTAYLTFPAPPGYMLVGRLDAHDYATVRRMIDDAIATEKQGLRGMTYLDLRGIKSGGYSQGDLWLEDILSQQREHGMPVIRDRAPGILPDGYAMRDAAFYYGWYTEHVKGPFLRADFRFKRGAIACHIHSFSASSLRDPGKHWSAPLLARGAAVTVGNVYEPYLDLTHHLDILHNRLLKGFTLIEAAWMAMKTTSWTYTILGDPLYRPFPNGEKTASAPSDGVYESLRTELLAAGTNPAAQETAYRRAARTSNDAIFLEALAALQRDASQPATANRTLEEARKAHRDADDQARVLYQQVRETQAAAGQIPALELLRKHMRALSGSESFAMLQALETELDPPPPPPPVKK